MLLGVLPELVNFHDHHIRAGICRIVDEDESGLLCCGHSLLTGGVTRVTWNVVHQEERTGLALEAELSIGFLLCLLCLGCLFGGKLRGSLLLFLFLADAHEVNWTFIIVHDALLTSGLELFHGATCEGVRASCCFSEWIISSGWGSS